MHARSQGIATIAPGALLLLAACGADAWVAETDNDIREPAREGPGGPGGDFDWCIPPGQVVVFDTTSAMILGGPDCVPTTSVNVLGGVLELRNLSVGAGAVLRVQGPNPFVILATGEVTIDGTIDVSGSPSFGVTSINTTNIPEPGALGHAGGGRGGTGSPLTTATSPEGGDGFGAFGTPGAGGAGGETGWNNIGSSNLDGRRGAGGGGGVLARNQGQPFGATASYGDWDQRFIGLDAEPGFPNLNANAKGANSGVAGPLGGTPGAGPFADADPRNDFYGVAVEPGGGALLDGELLTPWAGAGGGGGGDASFVGVGGTFPNVPFSNTGDEKGAGGGGGGGVLHVIAVGDVVFGPQGLIKSRGGSGGGGEITLFFERVGGASGGGSGGQVILETAGHIDFSQVSMGGPQVGTLLGGILATGGQGGAGRSNQGGAIFGSNGSLETLPELDGCPPTSLGGAYPTSGPNACQGHTDGAGGDGGPGLIQLHTRNGFDPADPGILLPPGSELGDVCQPLPVGTREDLRLLPRFVLGRL